MTEPTIVHLVPHTHWDREWYEPFQTFRMRLVDLIDQLLERMDRDDRLHFTLDGQAATVDDYLEVRPEAEPLIRRLDRRGSAGHRPVADPARRVPRLGRDDRAQPRARLGSGGGPRGRHARRLPARHVRPHRPDAPDPAPGRHRPRRRLARRPERHHEPRLPLGGPRRIGRGDRRTWSVATATGRTCSTSRTVSPPSSASTAT